jgi:4-hydroxy-tetrahydrodipicolinate reductase
MARIRVAQWGTGNVGRKALAAVLDRADLELVGVLVAAPAKVGQDAGTLLGRGAVGVGCTDQLAAIVALKPDVVLHMPLPSTMVRGDPSVDERNIRLLLEAGINVITTVGYVYPKAYGLDVLARLEASCQRGGASLHGTGLNPGFHGERLPLTLAGLCQDVRSVTVSEATVFASYASPDILFGLMGMGLAPETFAGRTALYRRWLKGLFGESVMLVAEGLGLAVDSIEDGVETALAHTNFTIAAGTISAGTVAAQRWRWAALCGGAPRVIHQTTWRAHADAAPDWPRGENSVVIEATPAITLPLPHGWVSDGLAATAYHAVNAIPAVVAAAPGICTCLDLPMLGAWAT